MSNSNQWELATLLIVASLVACGDSGSDIVSDGGANEPVAVASGVLVYEDSRAPHGEALIEGVLGRDDACGLEVDGVALILPSTADIRDAGFEIGDTSFAVGERVTLGGGALGSPRPPGLSEAGCPAAQFFKVAWEQS